MMDFVGLIPSFGNAAYTIVFFIIALSIIVAVHEYGHYIVGRWSGIHAEVFSLGFGPVLYSRVDMRGTRWQVAALPFGGYVKFLGDADAASGRDGAAMAGLSDGERRHTMHGAPLWARAATVAAGPVFNFALSVLVFGFFIAWQGTAVPEPTVGSLRPLPSASAGLQPGDTILAIAGQPTPDYETMSSVVADLTPTPQVDYTVRRAGQDMTVTGGYPFPPLVAQLMPGFAAAKAGLQEGDVITVVNGTPVFAFSQLQAAVAGAGDDPVALTVWRAGQTFDVTLSARLSDTPTDDGGFEQRLLLGIFGDYAFAPQTRSATVADVVKGSVGQTWSVATSSLSGMYHMIAGRISSCNLSGPIRMANFVGDAARGGVEQFFWRLAQISTAIGLLNLFPIPVLDGGHLVFFAWEAVRGKPPSDRALRVLMSVGLVLILSLMVFALGNDLFCP